MLHTELLAKSSECVTILERATINPEYGVNCHIFTVLFKIKITYLYDDIFKNNKIFLNI